MFYLYRFSNRGNLNEKINWDDVFDNEISIEEMYLNRPVKIDCFSLSENDKKNGGYLSFLHSNGCDSIDRIKKCFSWYKEKRSGFPLYFGFCEIDKNIATNEINDDEDIIKFEKKGDISFNGTTHYGMFYVTSNNESILEAKNALVLMSKFFPCKKYKTYEVVGDITSKRTIENTYVLEWN